MKHNNHKKGLTLIELVLAITILSFMSMAMGALSISAARMTTSASTEIQLQNELNYVLRDMELNIKSGKEPVVSATSGIYILTVTDPDGNTISYSYNSGTQLLSRTMGGVVQNLSTGVLIPLSARPVFAVSSNGLIEINLTAQREIPDGKTINVPGITKSILLRGSSS